MKYLFFLFVFTYANLLFSRTESKKKLSLPDSVLIKEIDELNAAAEKMRDSLPGRSFELADEAFSRADSCGYDDGKGLARLTRAYYYINAENYSLATQDTYEAKKTFTRTNNIQKLCRCYILFSVIYSDIEEYDKAEAEINEGIALAEKHKDFKTQSRLLTNLGHVYHQRNSLDTSIKISEKALVFAKKINDTDLTAFLEANIGSSYYELENFSASRTWYLSAVEYYRASNSITTYRKILVKLGDIHQHLGDFNNSKDYYKKGIEVAIAQKKSANEADIRFILAELYYKNQQYTDGIKELEICLDIYSKNNMEADRADVCDRIAKCYFGLKDEKKGFAWRKKTISLLDKLIENANDYKKRDEYLEIKKKMISDPFWNNKTEQ